MIKIDKTLMEGSFALLVMINLFNLLNFAFQFSMARMLSVAEYGILATLVSFYYVFGIFSESLQTVITRYVSAESSPGKIKNIMMRSVRRSSHLSLFLFLFYLVMAVPMSKILSIGYPLLALNGVMLFAAVFLPVSRGILLGGRRFGAAGANMTLEGLLKLGLAVGFVAAGWGVAGAVGGAVTASFLAFIVSLKTLRGVLSVEEQRADIPSIYAYSPPVFIAILALMLFYSLDIIVARVVFDDVAAGRYAFASVLAKSIFLLTYPISKAMFPLSSGNRNDGGNSRAVYWNSFVMLLVLISMALFVFYFLSGLLIRFFTGQDIPESASLLFILGAAAGFLALANLNIFYRLSLGETAKAPGLFIFVAMEIVLLLSFSHDLFRFSLAFLAASALFFGGSLLIPGRHETLPHHSRS